MTTISRPEQIFDVRLIDCHLNKGKITRRDLEQYLKQLPDASENSEVISRDVLFDKTSD